MNEIGKRISSARAAAGISQTDLARMLKVSPQAVQKWESGGAPRGHRLSLVAKILGTSVEYLINGDDAAKRPERITTIDACDIVCSVPVISWVRAGNWSQAIENFDATSAEDWIPCPKKCSNRTFALKVRGASMEPKYNDGDIIFVDPDIAADNGKNVVIRLTEAEEATFKQLIIEGESRYLRAINSDWPGPKIIQITEEAVICGVVIGKWVQD